MRRIAAKLCSLPVVSLWLAAAGGCNSGLFDHVNWGPFRDKENTSIITPNKRTAQLQQQADEAGGKKPAEQEQLVNQLALDVQKEEDPLLREQILRTLGRFATPTSRAVLRAALKDNDSHVRVVACGLAARQGGDEFRDALAEALKSDTDLDVRLAAARALGRFKGPETVSALAVALDDNDTALQYRAVESLRSASGKDLGSDVAAWRAYVKNEPPPPARSISVADRLRKYSPF